MAKDVHRCIVQILAKYARMSPQEAEQYVMRMMQSRRYVQDIWS